MHPPTLKRPIGWPELGKRYKLRNWGHVIVTPTGLQDQIKRAFALKVGKNSTILLSMQELLTPWCAKHQINVLAINRHHTSFQKYKGIADLQDCPAPKITSPQILEDILKTDDHWDHNNRGLETLEEIIPWIEAEDQTTATTLEWLDLRLQILEAHIVDDIDKNRRQRHNTAPLLKQAWQLIPNHKPNAKLIAQWL